MPLQERRDKVKQEVIAKELNMWYSTVRMYFQGRLHNTATERKIAKYLDQVHEQEIKGLLSSKK